jgi:hypothetical protein
MVNMLGIHRGFVSLSKALHITILTASSQSLNHVMIPVHVPKEDSRQPCSCHSKVYSPPMMSGSGIVMEPWSAMMSSSVTSTRTSVASPPIVPPPLTPLPLGPLPKAMGFHPQHQLQSFREGHALFHGGEILVDHVGTVAPELVTLKYKCPYPDHSDAFILYTPTYTTTNLIHTSGSLFSQSALALSTSCANGAAALTFPFSSLYCPQRIS